MDKFDKYKNLDNDVVMKRLEQLPDAYGIAVETIVDRLDKDWQNRVIYTKYVALLCDIFEEAIQNGQSVEDVCGSDIIAYAKQFQANHDFRELEATDFSKLINKILLFNVIFVMSSFILYTPITELMYKPFSMLYVGFIVIGLFVFIAGIVLKYNYFMKQKLPTSHVFITMIINIAVLVLSIITRQGTNYILVGIVAICLYDFMTINKKAKA